MEHFLYSGDKKHIFAGLVIISVTFGVPWYYMNRGAARGCGWQNACAFINLGAYYFTALPCAILFAFVFQIGGMGLWMGIICGLSVQVIALVTLNLRTNWNEEARKAFNRIQSG